MKSENKTTIVTGAGRSLGKGTALKLTAEGVKIIVADISMEAASATAEEVNASSGIAKALAVNIVKQDEVKAMMDFTVESFGILDVIINNTGVSRDAVLHKMTIERWDRVIAANLTGTFYCVWYAIQIMRGKGSGATISISSASWLGNIGQANYAAPKAGVVGPIRTACRELARRDVTYNTIYPGFIDTGMTRGVPEKIWDTMISKIPMGRTSSPADAANMVAFLASDEADYVTGEVTGMGGGVIL